MCGSKDKKNQKKISNRRSQITLSGHLCEKRFPVIYDHIHMCAHTSIQLLFLCITAEVDVCRGTSGLKEKPQAA